MSNSVIKRELTALLQDKEHFDFLRHQRILVTGATGLIGSMFIKLLILANETYNLDLKVIGHVRSHDKAQAILGDYLDNDSITLILSFSPNKTPLFVFLLTAQCIVSIIFGSITGES